MALVWLKADGRLREPWTNIIIITAAINIDNGDERLGRQAALDAARDKPSGRFANFNLFRPLSKRRPTVS